MKRQNANQTLKRLAIDLASHPFLLFLAFLGTIAHVALSIYLPILIGQVIDQVLVTGSSPVFWQIFILSTLGISLAVLALLGTQLVLPASMPFYSDWRAYAGLIVLIVFMSLAGGLLSIHRVLKIDPITAIGGE